MPVAFWSALAENERLQKVRLLFLQYVVVAHKSDRKRFSPRSPNHMYMYVKMTCGRGVT